MVNSRTGTYDSLEELARQVISLTGEDPNREGLKETPKRVAKTYKELLSGYEMDPSHEITMFDSNGFNELVSVTEIDFYSLCEHHMLPFFGKVHIGYVPDKKILGLSKFSRIVDIYSRRLQTQENLTKQIFDLLENKLSPKGLIVSIEARHLCVRMRGVKEKGSSTKTTIKNGILLKRRDFADQFFIDSHLKVIS
ncbi:MAG: GTP cyclohydrolase I [Candidatus Woesebacteria bacterium GW2011_GWA2_40_7]|uniref:GTP cyclohydrolase 1 n=3 Tax=Candidatus Woeseibacteriota TaxID=1752722 RepID=A0A0G0X7H8_9BACT|nr:MAG: GTP cyclohydrolase I [Candidatus Woesebacteria bacterium GW2011_GWB1_39_10]KKR73025.1 MAG: GTP cyclohydrolase I [Candidatus Woesebacteria bacterium GW2011_GWA2_40_7]KKR92590.1 MAG: GTP cyclohydrolase I [Candidatus Woesebacteria bacterium GW2011_GWA1_41_13b]